MRVYEIAKEVGIPNKELLAKIRSLGLEVNILRAAVYCFARSGYAQTSNRDIAQAAETSA